MQKNVRKPGQNTEFTDTRTNICSSFQKIHLSFYVVLQSPDHRSASPAALPSCVSRHFPAPRQIFLTAAPHTGPAWNAVFSKAQLSPPPSA